MIKVVKEFQIGPNGRESFVNDLSRDEAARFNMLMADMYGDDAYYDDLTAEEWRNLKDAFNGQMTESKKVTESFFRDSFEDWYDFLDDEERAEVDQYMEDEGMPDMVTDLSRTDMENILGHFDSDHLEDLYDQEDEGNRIKGGWQFDEGPYDEVEESKKVTESFRQDFYDWYDGLNGYWQAKVDEFIEDEGYPDMITDLSEADMEIIMDEFNPEYFDTDEEDLDEGCKTEASRMGNEFYGGGTVYVGLYGDDCGSYGSLDEFKSALKKSNIKILDVSGDEEYGWDMTVKGIAKEIYKLVDGKIPGYDCDDVTEFIEEYSLDPEEFEDHDKDVYSPEFIERNSDEDLDEGYKTEDTVKKSNGKWTNKGKNGEHGEFKSKKAADAQRKAMFANGYKESYDSFDDEYSDFDDNEVHIGNTFIEGGEEYEWVDQASDVYYLDFDAWQVWKATSVDSGEDAYFVVDKDTGFIDWGPCGEEEAIEFLRSKVDDYNEDL